MDEVNLEAVVLPLERRAESQMEFSPQTNLEKVIEELILSANFDEVAAWIDECVVPYGNMVITEDTEVVAKEVCAKINKIAQNIDAKRKGLEAEWKKPFGAFKAKCDELIKRCATTREKIWSQIKSAVEAEKQQKEIKYRQYWNDNAGRTALYRDWNVIREDWYFNRTASTKKVQDDIQRKIDGIKTDLEAIYSLKSKNEAALLAKYADGATLSETIEYRLKIEAQAEQTQTAPTQEAREPETVTPPQPITDALDEDEEIQQIDFRVWVTITQARLLKDFFKAHNIKYGKVTV